MIMILHGFLALTALIHTVTAAPVNSFPFNNQIPPVARYGQDYYYQIRSDTFTSSISEITYTASNIPDWLTFDQTNLVLSGKPTTDNPNPEDYTVNFQLTGTDTQGSTSSDCSFILSAASPPTVNEATTYTLENQLRSQGETDGSTGFVIVPGHDFNISLSQQTFLAGSREIIGHYGIMANHTPLPIWMTYDESTLSYQGTAPVVNSEVAAAQRYELLFVAADYSGYLGASVQFALVVGAHRLVSNISNTTLTVNNNQTINYTIPIDQILIDNSQLTLTDVASFSSNVTDTNSWLSFDTTKGTLSGTVPEDASEGTMGVSLQILDINGNQVNYVLTINIQNSTQNSLFTTSTFPNVNITRNEFFNYTIPSSYLASTNNDSITYAATFSPSSDESWISFNSGNLTFLGNAPNSLTDLTVSLVATDASQNDFTESRSFNMTVVDKRIILSSTSSISASKTSMSVSATSATSTSSNTSSTDSSASTAAEVTEAKKGSNKTLAIALGVALPCAAILAAIFLFFCYRRRNHKSADKTIDGDTSDGSAGAIVSTPPGPNTPGTGPINGTPVVGGHISRGAAVITTPALNALGQDSEKGFDTPPPAGPFMANGALTTPPMANQLRTPSAPGSAGTAEEWDTPKRMSNLNFYRIDGEEEEKDIGDSDSDYETNDAINRGSSYSSNETKVDNNSDVNIDDMLANIENDIAAAGARTSTGTNMSLAEGAVIADYAIDGPTGYGNPHQSWRQTIESNRRWQNRDSLASLATVSTSELFSVRVADEENTDGNNYRDSRMNDFPDDEAQGAAASRNMPRDDSSGILRPISAAMSLSSVYSTTDNRNSIYSEGNTDQNNIHNNYRASKHISNGFPTPNNLAAVTEEGSHINIRPTYNDSMLGLESSDASFETASAGSGDHDHLNNPYNGENNLGDMILRSTQGAAVSLEERNNTIRPFRDQTGRISFRNTLPAVGGVTGGAHLGDISGAPDTETEAYHDTVLRQHTTDGISDDDNIDTSIEDNARLVNFTNRRSIVPTTNTSVKNLDKSISGELAFL